MCIAANQCRGWQLCPEPHGWYLSTLACLSSVLKSAGTSRHPDIHAPNCLCHIMPFSCHTTVSIPHLQALEHARQAVDGLVDPLERHMGGVKKAQEAAGLAAIKQMLHSQGAVLRSAPRPGGPYTPPHCLTAVTSASCSRLWGISPPLHCQALYHP